MYCLIVDDEKQTREGLMKLLPWAQLGIERLEFAADGAEALRIITQHGQHRDWVTPDLVLCDVRMPHMNGVELVRRLREGGFELPVIFMSGYSDKEYLKAAIKYQAVAYVEKPIDIDELVAAVSEALRRLDSASCPTLAELVNPNSDFAGLAERLSASGHPLAHCSRLAVLAANLQYRLLNSAFAALDIPAIYGELNGISIVICAYGDSAYFDRVFECLSSHYAGCTLGISAEASALCELPTCCAQAEHAFARRWLGGSGRAYWWRQSGSGSETSPSYARARRFADTTLESMLDCLRTNKEQLMADHLAVFEHWLCCIDGLDRAYVLSLFRLLRDSVLTALPGLSARIRGDTQLSGLWESVESADSLATAAKRFRDWLKLLCDRYIVLKKYNAIVARAVLYMNLHFMENITIDDLAHECMVSASHLSYLFKQNLNCTMKNYLTELRIEKAKSYLNEPDVPLYEVCAKVGIDDAAYFSRLFRKLVGMPPSAYRERLPR